jgi:hypothetical protein
MRPVVHVRLLIGPALGTLGARQAQYHEIAQAGYHEPDGGPILLELTAPPGTREFVAALLGV